jgi:prepilin-type N-terminal cleavage/methylation domain-containing protein
MKRFIKYKKGPALNQSKGLTIIEMTVVIGILSILTVIMSQFIARSLKTYRSAHQNVDLQEKTSQVLREFEFSTRAATEILTADSDELTFYRYYDISTSSSPTKIRYFVEGNIFKVGKSLPVGMPPNVTYPNETIDFLVEDLVNPGQIFHYYDNQGQELNQPVALSAVTMIGLEFTLDKDPDKPPAAITEITKVDLRNMKKNL